MRRRRRRFAQITVELKPADAEALVAAARRLGVTPTALVRRLIRAAITEEAQL